MEAGGANGILAAMPKRVVLAPDVQAKFTGVKTFTYCLISSFSKFCTIVDISV